MSSRRAPLSIPSKRALSVLLGAAICAAGLSAASTDRAAAQGRIYSVIQRTPFRPTYVLLPLSPNAGLNDEPEPLPGHARITVVSPNGDITSDSDSPVGAPVCVRLCDGAFFPLSVADGASGAAACNSQCPDAPTEIYYRNGSDQIEDAVSADGRPYTALRAALLYRTSADKTCACHRGFASYAPLDDPTLKAGDAIMTPAGFVVFRGAEAATHGPDEFTPLAKSNLPPAVRGALRAMERVSLEKDRPTLKQWLASPTTPALPEGAIAHMAGGDDKIRLLVWRGARD